MNKERELLKRMVEWYRGPDCMEIQYTLAMMIEEAEKLLEEDE